MESPSQEKNQLVLGSSIEPANESRDNLCLETLIKLVRSPHEDPTTSQTTDGESEKYKPDLDNAIANTRTELLADSDILIIADRSDFARDYGEAITEGIDALVGKVKSIPHSGLSGEGGVVNPSPRASVVFNWNEYFDSRDLSKGVCMNGKLNFALMMNCLADTLEYSRGKYTIIIICAGNDNVNDSRELYSSLEKLTAVVNKHHVDIHCIGVGAYQDVIMLDSLMRIATCSGSYRSATSANNLTSCITNMYEIIAKPSVRVNYEITPLAPQSDAKLYKADVRCVSCNGDTEFVFSARLYGKFDTDFLANNKIRLLIANGAYQQILDYDESSLSVELTPIMSGANNIATYLGRLKLQLDAICNCLKYEMNQSLLEEFRMELDDHLYELNNILHSRDIYSIGTPTHGINELALLDELFVYVDLLIAQYKEQLVNGVLNVSIDDYCRILNTSSICQQYSQLTEGQNSQSEEVCIQYTITNGRVRIHDTISLGDFELQRKYPRLFKRLGIYVNNSMLIYRTNSGSFDDMLLVMSGIVVNEANSLFEAAIKSRKNTQDVALAINDLIADNGRDFGNASHAIRDLVRLSGAVNYLGYCGDNSEGYGNDAYSAAKQIASIIAFRLSLRREMASEANHRVKLCEILIAHMKVNENIYKDKLDSVRTKRGNINSKNIELQAQSEIINEMKSRKFKYIKPHGKRNASTPKVIQGKVASVNWENRVTKEEMSSYVTALNEYITIISGKCSNIPELGTWYKDWVVSPQSLKSRVSIFAELYPGIFHSELDEATVKNIIGSYIAAEKKKILDGNDKFDRNEKIKVFVTTDKIYAAAGLLRGAFLGVNLSQYLGTLCEAVNAGEIKVPLIAEKLSMIITGKLITNAATGETVNFPDMEKRETVGINELVLVEDIDLHVRQRGITYSDHPKYRETMNNCITKKQMVNAINKYSVDSKREKSGVWILGKKKRSLVGRMLAGKVSNEVLTSIMVPFNN